MQDPFNSDAPSGATASSTSPDRFSERTASPSNPAGQVPAPAGGAGQAASSLAGQAKQKLAGTLDSQKSAAADFVEQLAQQVHRSGEHFEGQQDWIASAVGRGAAELHMLAGAIRNKDLGEFASEIGTFARRQPALFIGATLAAGFAVARLGKVVASDVSRDDLPSLPEVEHGQH